MYVLIVNDQTHTDLRISQFIHGSNFSITTAIVQNSINPPTLDAISNYSLSHDSHHEKHTQCHNLELSEEDTSNALACISFYPDGSTDEDDKENLFLLAMGRVYLDDVNNRLLYIGPRGDDAYWVWEIKK